MALLRSPSTLVSNRGGLSCPQQLQWGRLRYGGTAGGQQINAQLVAAVHEQFSRTEGCTKGSKQLEICMRREVEDTLSTTPHASSSSTQHIKSSQQPTPTTPQLHTSHTTPAALTLSLLIRSSSLSVSTTLALSFVHTHSLSPHTLRTLLSPCRCRSSSRPSRARPSHSTSSRPTRSRT